LAKGWDLMLRIDAGSPIPPYEQLRDHLARQITDRVLPVGTRLPTVRGLATTLGLAVNTVARAFRELERAGLIETRGRAGSFVAAAGERSRERACQAAQQYAVTVRGLGIGSDEALRLVAAALSAAPPAGTP